MIFLNKNASFAEVASYVKNQLINKIHLDVDFVMDSGVYIMNIRIGGASMFSKDAVRITEKKAFSWIFNIVIKKGYAMDRNTINMLFAYIDEISQYLDTRDHAKDMGEWWEKYEKKELR